MTYIDPVKLVAAVDGGARSGFDLVFPELIFNFIATLCQYLSTCIGMVTRKNLAEVCSEEYSRLHAFFLGVLAEQSMIVSDLTIVLGIAHDAVELENFVKVLFAPPIFEGTKHVNIAKAANKDVGNGSGSLSKLSRVGRADRCQLAAILDEFPGDEELERDSHFSNEISSTWLMGTHNNKEKKRYIDLGCVLCELKLLRAVFLFLIVGFLVIGLPIIVYKHLPGHRQLPPLPDEYAIALNKALLFFNAQRSGRLPMNNVIPWRGNSGLEDGSTLSDVKGGLVGGYYDGGDNIKYHFPMAFSMTLLSWSVIEYGHKYKAIGEYNHIRETIKWGTDYLLLTFNSSDNTINKIYSQVGAAKTGSTNPDDHYCWQRPEDMEYPRPVQTVTVAPDLAGELGAALAAASIVFHDDTKYSEKLVHAAKTAYKFAKDPGQQTPYSYGNDAIVPFYNSSGFWDELIWGAAWMFYATGNYSYLSLATSTELRDNANAFSHNASLSVFSWDNKLPGAELLLARLRIILNPGYPYEEMLRDYHRTVDFNMCSLLKMFKIFKYSKGGLIQLNHRKPQPLSYAVNAAFLATLYSDYMNGSNVPGCYCGTSYVSARTLRKFAISQVNYILGKNPMNMSYVVGYGQKFPRHVHHRGASIPFNQRRVSCTAGWKWRDAKSPNPHVITGAMVGGPDQEDHFIDRRQNYSYTEPTLAGNAGLVAALVALASSSIAGNDRNGLFADMDPPYMSPPPPMLLRP